MRLCHVQYYAFRMFIVMLPAPAWSKNLHTTLNYLLKGAVSAVGGTLIALRLSPLYIEIRL